MGKFKEDFFKLQKNYFQKIFQVFFDFCFRAMKFRTAAWLIGFTCLLLLGFQAYLLREAFRLQERDLHKRIDQILENTISAYDSLLAKKTWIGQHDPVVLDSLLGVFQVREKLDEELVLAITKPGGGEVYYTSDDVPLRLFYQSPHRRWLRGMAGEPWPRECIVVPRHWGAAILSRINAFVFGFLVISAVVITTLLVVWRQYLNQKQLSELKSEFINNLSHEFRTPLASIGLAAETLQSHPETHNSSLTRKYAALIKDQVRLLERHVTTVLEAAEQEKRGLSIQKQKVNLLELLEKACAVIRLQYPKAALDLKVSGCGPVVLVRADEAHLTHVFLNILDNAIKYNRQETPRVNMEVYREKSLVVVVFQDNGIGIPRRHLKGIFQRFYRVPQAPGLRVKGFGLGLSYVRQAVAQHGAQIFIWSKPEQGTRLELRFPAIL